MRALVLQASGEVENFVIRKIAKPSPREHQVLIRVAAASLNQIDNKIRRGLPIGPELPGVLGCDFAGVIEEVGASANGFKIGDEVYGCAGGVRGHSGTLCEFIAADYRLIAHKPSNLSMRQAAALPLVSITAWEAIDRARIKNLEDVLVHAGAGGVGHVAVQLAHHVGARVSATVGDEVDGSVARSFGAENIILYPREQPSEYVQRLTDGLGFPVIIDTVGGENLERSFEAASLNGRISTTASRIRLDLSPMHAKGLSVNVIFMLLPMLANSGKEQHGRILREVTKLVEGGTLFPHVDPNPFTLSTAAEGYRLLEAGRSRGKVVVDIQ